MSQPPKGTPAKPIRASAGKEKSAPNESASNFEKLDVTDDNQLSEKEYVSGHAKELTPGKDFNTLDTDSDGFLSEDEFNAGFDSPWLIFIAALLVLILPAVIGSFLAKRLRMPDYGWKIGLILFTLVASSTFVWQRPLKFGIDLSGGVNLIYRIDKEKTKVQLETFGAKSADEKKDYMNRLVAALNLRVNPSGQKSLIIRPYGTEHIEVIIPNLERAEIERVEENHRHWRFSGTANHSK